MSAGEPLEYRNLLKYMSVEDESWDRKICNFCGHTIRYGEKGSHGDQMCNVVENSSKPLGCCRLCSKQNADIYWKASGLCNECEEDYRSITRKTERPWVKRLSKPEYLCYLALAASSRAEDIHTRVGGVIVNKDWRILNTAFNGWQAGKSIPPEFLLDENRDKKGEFITHCEQNLFNFYHDIPYAVGLTISPCFACSKTIASHSSIKEIFYIKEYERDKELKFKKVFDFYNIKYTQMTKENIKNILDFMKEDMYFLEKLLC